MPELKPVNATYQAVLRSHTGKLMQNGVFSELALKCNFQDRQTGAKYYTFEVCIA